MNSSQAQTAFAVGAHAIQVRPDRAAAGEVA
jgi:hypothetical protein